MNRVVIAPQERIDDFERTAVEFFRTVLGMDYGECIVTDESRRSDFASCGLPEDIADATQSLKALYSAWDAWVVSVICSRYDFQPGSYGYRPKRTAHQAVDRVAGAIVQQRTCVIDLDLGAYFDTVRHHLLPEKVARRIDDDDVMRLE